jgi:hypothetical protein
VTLEYGKSVPRAYILLAGNYRLKPARVEDPSGIIRDKLVLRTRKEYYLFIFSSLEAIVSIVTIATVHLYI